MSNKWHGTLYVGVTAYLSLRIHQHRTGAGAAFAAKYGLKRLVWYDSFGTIAEAIHMEKRLKKWPREWKVALIEKGNPTWADLYPTLPV